MSKHAKAVPGSRRTTAAISLIAAFALLVSTPSASAQAPAECNGLPVTIFGTDGNDDLLGTDGDDVISLLDGDDTVSSGAGNDTICDGEGAFIVDAGDGDDTVISGAGSPLDANEIHTGLGNDTVTLLTDQYVPVIVRLGPGADTIDVVGYSDSVVYGDDGDDVLRSEDPSWSSSSYLYGGAGNDRITGNQVSGDQGNDHITVVGQWASIYGGDGDDRIVGSSWDDEMRGGAGNDVLIGKGGNDKLYGLDGDDLLLGGTGTDLLDGARGNDKLKGGAQLDTLQGGWGFDELYGGSGNDNITDNKEGAIIRGGKGADTIEITSEADPSTVMGGPGADTVVARGYQLEIHGDGGPDSLSLQMSDSTVYGDAGHDEIVYKALGPDLVFFLGSGDDLLVEKAGQRHLAGIEVSAGPGDDVVMGTNFPDILRGNSGNDWMDGREGDDIVEGGKDNDWLAGGLGADAVRGGSEVDGCLLGHLDIVDVDEPGYTFTWEGPPDQGDVGDCEQTWGEPGYWYYETDQLFASSAMNAAYYDSAISVDVYGLDADLEPAATAEADSSNRPRTRDHFSG